MADPKITQFIKNAQTKGYSRSDIEKVLASKGWTDQQIKEAFTAAASGAATTGSSSMKVADEVKKLKAQGLKDDQIRKKLIAKGMDPAQIDQVLKATTKKRPPGQNKGLLIALAVAGTIVILGIIIGIALFAGGDRPECQSDRECPGVAICLAGNCQQVDCISDRDCSTGQTCSNNRCQVQAPEPECRSDFECSTGEACIGGTCQPDLTPTPGCVSDTDCAALEICQAGSCTAVECKANADCGAGFDCVSNSCTAQPPSLPLDNASEENYEINDQDVSFETVSETEITLSFQALNDGIENNVSSFDVSCELLDSNETSIETVTVSVDTVASDAFAEGECTFDATPIYDRVVAGEDPLSVTVEVEIDVDNVIDESNENDNDASKERDLTLDDFTETATTTGCTDDSECSTGYACETTNGSCYESCTDNTQCTTGYECNNNVCEETVIITGCSDDSECTDGYACDLSTSTCYETCTDNTNCTEGYECNNDICELIPTTTGGQIGDSCAVDDDCEGDTICRADILTCQECTATKEGGCGDYKCNTADAPNTCRTECLGDNHCQDGFICESNACVSGTRADCALLGESCPDAMICNAASGACEQCSLTDLSQCNGYGCFLGDKACRTECELNLHCDIANGYTCNTDTNTCEKDLLEVGEVCFNNDECASNYCKSVPPHCGCLTDADCPTDRPYCDENEADGTCFAECVTDQHCIDDPSFGAGFTCIDHACISQAPGARDVGEDCERNDQCESGLCDTKTNTCHCVAGGNCPVQGELCNSYTGACQARENINQCANGIDDDSPDDGFIDNGGCDCYNENGENIPDGKIDTYLPTYVPGQETEWGFIWDSTVEDLCVTRYTDEEFDAIIKPQSLTRNECPGAGEWYDRDPSCLHHLDDNEVSDDPAQFAPSLAPTAEKSLLQKIIDFIFFVDLSPATRYFQ